LRRLLQVGALNLQPWERPPIWITDIEAAFLLADIEVSLTA
jgi:hypothetical protein